MILWSHLFKTKLHVARPDHHLNLTDKALQMSLHSTVKKPKQTTCPNPQSENYHIRTRQNKKSLSTKSQREQRRKKHSNHVSSGLKNSEMHVKEDWQADAPKALPPGCGFVWSLRGGGRALLPATAAWKQHGLTGFSARSLNTCLSLHWNKQATRCSLCQRGKRWHINRVTFSLSAFYTQCSL